MNNIKRYIRFSDFKAGFLYALVGSALFSIIEGIRISIVSIGDDHFDLLPIIIAFFLFFFIFCLFSAIPAGIGGCVLGLLLRNQERNGTLTRSKAVRTGVLLAGMAIIIIIFWGGLLDMELLTHGMRWNSFTVDLKQGTFISNIPGYIQDFLDFVKFRFIEILLAITIACAEGGWFGRRIAKQLLTVDVKN